MPGKTARRLKSTPVRPSLSCARCWPATPHFPDSRSPARVWKKLSWPSLRTTAKTAAARTNLNCPSTFREDCGRNEETYDEHCRSGSSQHPSRAFSKQHRHYLPEGSKVCVPHEASAERLHHICDLLPPVVV